MIKKILKVIAILAFAWFVWWLFKAPIPAVLTKQEQDCINSGGNIAESICCKATDDFPNTCLIGPCGCSSEYSHLVKICDCGEDMCFDGEKCVFFEEEKNIESGLPYEFINEIGKTAGFEFEPLSTDMMATNVVWNTPEGEFFLEGAGYGFSDNLGSALIDEQYRKINDFLRKEGFETDAYNAGSGTPDFDWQRYKKDNIICNLSKKNVAAKGSSSIEIICADLDKEIFTDELTLTEIKNTEYYISSFGEKITLKGGYYRQNSDSMASVLSVAVYKDENGSNKVAFGDLNGDGKKDAAVILVTTEGGSGTFRELAVLINDNGKPSYLTSKLLGDRVIIESVDVNSGIIKVNMIIHGPKDPMCCPTLKQSVEYKLSNNQIIEI